MGRSETATVRCSACGYENRAGASRCEECRAALPPACAGCGAEITAAARFCPACGQAVAPSPPAAPLPSSFAGERYAVQGFIGEGSAKRVYLAHDTLIDREVAIALIKTEGLDAAGLARVRREALAMGRLGDHPHIVTIYDVADEAGQPFIVVQYMGGGDVERLLQEAPQHRLPLGQALRIATQVCQALEHAHRRHVIHRDLKPGNVWLTEEGTAKLGDFGLAVALDRQRLTAEGMMVGTFAYMPPEQALGRAPDPRSDLYSLGAMLYEMVTGRPPFLGDDAVSIIAQHINTAPVAPSWHNPEVPRALDALILQLLAKAPEERPPSAAAVVGVLAGIDTTATAVADRGPPYEANPLDRLAAGIFVGREREKDALRAAFEEALAGRGRLMQLAGEPGIGKTRMAEELATYARLRKAQVLWGRCYEGEGAPAYWPWVQIIRAYVHDRDPETLRTEMGPGAADIAQVVSAVRERLPDLPAPPPLEPEQARFRLFDSITTFLRNAANHRALVLILDDLHWADRPSLLLLQFLARELAESHLLVIGTYRDVEVRRHHPLAQALAELARAQLSQRILLRGLGARDIARFIEMSAAVHPPPALVEAVHAETEGNPFFVSEIVHLLVTDGRLERLDEVKRWSVAIPQSIREVIGRRLDHLSAECNRVLTVAAVIGREFSLEALERVGEVGGERLLEALEEAVAARVVMEVPGIPGRHGFAHILIRETLYDELSTIRRVRLHRQIGEAFEDLYRAKPEPHLAELAYHFLAAAQPRDADKAIAYARRAADRAVALLAYEEGARLYGMALQALEQREPPDEAQRCQLLLALGDAQVKAGDCEAMRESFRHAAALARKLGAAEQLARAALGFAWWRDTGTVDQSEVELLEDALGTLGEGDSALRARVLARLAVSLYYGDAPERRDSLSQQAVDMARRIGDAATLAYALNCRRWALWGPENVEERVAAASEILRLAEQVKNPELALESRHWRLLSLLELGDIPAVDREMAAHARLAAELRQPQYLWYSALWKAMRALLAGRFEEAERLAAEALNIGHRMKTDLAGQAYGGQITVVRREEGRLQELLPWVQEAIKHTPAVPALRCGLASFYSELGQEAEARREFEALAERDFSDLPRDVTWLVSVVHLAEACAFLRDARRAAALYELLLPFGGRNVVIGPGLACHGSTRHYLGLLATTIGRFAEAAAHFEAALEFNARMGARPCAAHTQYQYAAMLGTRDSQGDRGTALALLNRALETAQELGMKMLLARATALKLKVQGAPHDIKGSIEAVMSAVQTERPDLRRHAAPDGTVTIMFTDIEEFTAMTERLGDRRAHEVLRAHNTIVRERVVADGGFEVKAQGDGFMIAFRSARRALHCAVAIQRAMAARAAEHPKTSIRVRIGLHTGEAIREAADFFGKAVILAARIAAQARGGQILVSSLVRDLTESAGEFTFDEGREVALKGLTGTYTVFEVRS